MSSRAAISALFGLAVGGLFACGGDDASDPDAANLPDAWQNPDAPTGPDASTLPDAVPPPDVQQAPPWGTPTLIAALEDPLYHSRSPTLSQNRLELYFDSDRGDLGWDIWRSTRASTSDAWATPSKVNELSDNALWETGPSLSPSGLTIWLNRNAEGEDRDIYVATRPNPSSPWSSPTAVTALNTGATEGGVAASPNALWLAFESTRTGTMGGLDLFVATRASTGDPWASPAVLLGVNSTLNDTGPCFVDDGLSLYFSASRPGRGTDIFRVQRAGIAEEFESPTLVEEVSTTSLDSDPWVSPDETYMVFGSRRGGEGVMDLYETSR